MVTFQFVPYHEIEELGSARRVKKLINVVKDGKIALLQGRLRREEEADLIQIAMEEIDVFLFHQANLRINEKVAQLLGIPSAKVHNNIMRYGNCSAASIPMLLDECVRNERIKSGDRILMAAFGAGFTWAAGCLTW